MSCSGTKCLVQVQNFTSGYKMSCSGAKFHFRVQNVLSRCKMSCLHRCKMSCLSAEFHIQVHNLIPTYVETRLWESQVFCRRLETILTQWIGSQPCDSFPHLLQGCQIFKPKIQIWVIFIGPFNGRFWYILCPFGLTAIWYFYGYLIYFMVI
jgi:hypothetical protein